MLKILQARLHQHVNQELTDWGQEEKWVTEDEMAGWHHWLNGRESEWTPGVSDGQGGLASFLFCSFLFSLFMTKELLQKAIYSAILIGRYFWSHCTCTIFFLIWVDMFLNSCIKNMQFETVHLDERVIVVSKPEWLIKLWCTSWNNDTKMASIFPVQTTIDIN